MSRDSLAGSSYRRAACEMAHVMELVASQMVRKLAPVITAEMPAPARTPEETLRFGDDIVLTRMRTPPPKRPMRAKIISTVANGFLDSFIRPI